MLESGLISPILPFSKLSRFFSKPFKTAAAALLKVLYPVDLILSLSLSLSYLLVLMLEETFRRKRLEGLAPVF